MSRILPGRPFPYISLETLNGDTRRLDAVGARYMRIIDVYRGYHCPRCESHLRELSASLESFHKLDVDVVAISCDPKQRAEMAKADWGLANIDIGYGMTVEQAQTLGLFISEAISEKETRRFAEPGIFFVTSDGSLYGSIVTSFPFARPQVADLIEVVSIAKNRQYPPRGTWSAQIESEDTPK